MKKNKVKLSRKEKDAILSYLLWCAKRIETRAKFFFVASLITGINLMFIVIQILLWLLK